MTSGDILKLNGTKVSKDVIKQLMNCNRVDYMSLIGVAAWAVYLVDGQSIVVYLKHGGELRNDKGANT